jgi:hypothetical protein
MKDRRKRPDRRVTAPKQGLPPYYTRGCKDRRQIHAAAPAPRAEKTHREPATLDVFGDSRRPACDQA